MRVWPRLQRLRPPCALSTTATAAASAAVPSDTPSPPNTAAPEAAASCATIAIPLDAVTVAVRSSVGSLPTPILPSRAAALHSSACTPALSCPPAPEGPALP